MKKITFLLLTLLILASCVNKEEKEQTTTEETTPKVEAFSEKKPFSLGIKRERSYYQAQKISSRLNKMGLESYVLKEETEEGEWYQIVSGALKDSATAENYAAMLDTIYNLKPYALLNFQTLDSASKVPVTSMTSMENKRIDANEPDVPEEIMDVLLQYPYSDNYYLQNISIGMLNEQGSKFISNNFNLPQGITTEKLISEGCKSMASVVFTDNLFGENIILQIVKCKEPRQENNASILPTFNERNEEAVKLCSELADELINSTDIYAEKEAVEIESYNLLSGYSIKIKGYEDVTYYILTDEAGEYIYLANGLTSEEKNVINLLAEIGKSEGLKRYDEFYNTFYTVSDKMVEDDIFIGYNVNKLTKEYAEEKNNRNWAKKMVGHWCASFVFYNESKGAWSYSIFDLLKEKKRKHIYNNLYSSDFKTDEDYRNIYGTKGIAVYYYTTELIEINFGIKRFVVAINPYSHQLGRGDYNERDLILRGEKLQFYKGGYDGTTTKGDCETDIEDPASI